MKLVLKIVLLSFLFYQVVPTILLLLDENISYNIDENDEQDTTLKDLKFIQINIINVNNFILIWCALLHIIKIVSNNDLGFDTIFTKIFLNPPEFL